MRFAFDGSSIFDIKHHQQPQNTIGSNKPAAARHLAHNGIVLYYLNIALDEMDHPDSELSTESLTAIDPEVRIASALNSMSLEQRESAILETHGVSELHSEDEAFIDAKLAELEVELLNIPEKKAYYMAKATSPAYVCDRKFRLMFLRADNYDVPAAAKRLVNHFETKLDLFGKDLLGRNIRLSDLSEEDMKSLRAGGCQMLPHRDASGRLVLFYTPESYVAPIKSRVRAYWFLLMNVLRGELLYQITKYFLLKISISYQKGSRRRHPEARCYCRCIQCW